jgi:hypothetical protein
VDSLTGERRQAEIAYGEKSLRLMMDHIRFLRNHDAVACANYATVSLEEKRELSGLADDARLIPRLL